MLWNRSDVATLWSFATEYRHVHRALADGTALEVESWRVRFPPADPDRLADAILKKSYTVKPLVAPFGRALFGELAILRCLERDGWEGVWVDTYHGAELFWSEMPHDSQSVDLPLRPDVRGLYAGIIAEHGKRGGFFDVLAWRGDEFLFVEYKGKGDRPNSNELSWIAAALRYGVHPEQLLFVEYT